MQFLDRGSEYREGEEFPPGICEEDDYPNGIFPTDVTDLFDCDEYDLPDATDDDHPYDPDPFPEELAATPAHSVVPAGLFATT